MRKTEIRVEPVDAFFERGRKLARQADRERPFPRRIVVAFDNVESLLHVLTEKRVSLLQQLKRPPASISDLAKKLGRERSAVTRNIPVLERSGVLQVTAKPP